MIMELVASYTATNYAMEKTIKSKHLMLPLATDIT